MTSPQFQAALFRVVSMLLEFIAFGMIAAWFWAVSRLFRRRPLLQLEPFTSPRPATWGPGTLLAVLILYIAAQTAASTVYQVVVGVDLSETSVRYAAQLEDRNAAPDDEEMDPAEARRAATDATHLMTWNATFNLLFLAAFPWVFRRVSGASLTDLGVVRTRLGEQIQVGIVAGLLATPAVYAIHALALKVFPPRLHPVQQMLEVDFSLVMAGVSILSAVVLAPLFEETIFRGVLQGWLARVSAEILGDGQEPRPSTSGWLGPETPGVVLASALFAAVHFRQWPTPIPLFILAMVMGSLRRRTGSLLAPIIVHALFNATSTLGMLAMQLGRVRDLAPAVGGVAGPWGWLASMFS
jgi:membrane protease YdiL (CAAX protease family)